MQGEGWRTGQVKGPTKKDSGSCPKLMHSWSPEGHETKRLARSKRKTKKKKNGKSRGPLTWWHTFTSISISRRHREAYRATEDAFVRARVYGCTRRCARADARLDNSLRTMSAVVRNLPNCCRLARERLCHFISYQTSSVTRDKFMV